MALNIGKLFGRTGQPQAPVEPDAPGIVVLDNDGETEVARVALEADVPRVQEDMAEIVLNVREDAAGSIGDTQTHEVGHWLGIAGATDPGDGPSTLIDTSGAADGSLQFESLRSAPGGLEDVVDLDGDSPLDLLD